MRRLGFLLFVVFALAACQIGGGAGPSDAPKGGLMGEAVEVTTLAPLPDAGAAPADVISEPVSTEAPEVEPVAEAAVEETSETQPAETQPAETQPAETQPAETQPAETSPLEPSPPEPPPLPEEPQSPAQMACIKGGGVWSQAQSGVAFCQKMTKDGGKSCTKAGDCEGYCLAPSRSCAPVTPVFGCYEIMDELGRVITECVE